MRITGNKGEWSELYAFLKLLSMGKLYAADENVKRINDVYLPILKIIRCEESGNEVDYVISSTDGSVEIHCHSDEVTLIPQKELVSMASVLFCGIESGSRSAFMIEKSDEIMRRMKCSRIAAPSTDKTDITMQIHDIHTGFNPVCGFSIKSELGSPPTLLNASRATNFVFEVNGIDKEAAEKINAINSPNKIIARISEIRSRGSMSFVKAYNDTFAGNLMLIDTRMEEIIAEILLDYYMNNVSDCYSLVSRLEERNPLKYPRSGLYEYKYKKFLCSIALGMIPSRKWNGIEEANGGYVIVKDDGDVVAYHLYNRNAFESYLLKNTKFERASTSRHKYASIYYGDDGKMYINLNLQIRFG